MGDSDNSTPLPFVTSGKEIVRTTNVKRRPQPIELGRYDLDRDQTSDRAVTVWRQWQEAHNLIERLCREQQLLERKLAETIGFPRATILPNCVDAAARAKAEADFMAHQAKWDAAEREIGYSAAMCAEHEAANRAEALLEELFETPATTLAGVVAKLDAVLMQSQPSEDDAEFPWPQIRTAIEDVLRIDRRKEPG